MVVGILLLFQRPRQKDFGLVALHHICTMSGYLIGLHSGFYRLGCLLVLYTSIHEVLLGVYTVFLRGWACRSGMMVLFGVLWVYCRHYAWIRMIVSLYHASIFHGNSEPIWVISLCLMCVLQVCQMVWSYDLYRFFTRHVPESDRHGSTLDVARVHPVEEGCRSFESVASS